MMELWNGSCCAVELDNGKARARVCVCVCGNWYMLYVVTSEQLAQNLIGP